MEEDQPMPIKRRKVAGNAVSSAVVAELPEKAAGQK